MTSSTAVDKLVDRYGRIREPWRLALFLALMSPLAVVLVMIDGPAWRHFVVALIVGLPWGYAASVMLQTLEYVVRRRRARRQAEARAMAEELLARLQREAEVTER